MAAPSVSPQPTTAATSSRSRSPVRRSTATSTRRSRASRSPVPPNSRTSLSPLRKQNSIASSGGSQRSLFAQQEGSFVNLLGGRSLSPCRPSSRNVPKSALDRATSAPTNNSFLQYCQIHGHQVSEPELNRGGTIPLNRCNLTGSSTRSLNSFGTSFSNGMDGSSASLDGSFKRQLSTAADQAAGWFESWKLSGSSSHSDHCSPGNTTSSYYVKQHPLGRHCKTLQYSQADMLNVAMDDQTFRTLKSGLRKRGVITNNYLRENMHFYVQHMKKVEERKQQQQRARCHSPMGRNAAA